ncbi:MAG TPA: D-hexose-6-phosphate mutarotase, partial [Gemmatimonadaceae bacterium]|nr:D-hexose-6-phosphate mutarotase [Gemmatimonadaceae bacterium]
MTKTLPEPGAEIGTGLSGRSRIRLVHPHGGTVELYPHGGQVLTWKHPRCDALFLSERSDADQYVHAGIPIVFPQFGKGPGGDGALPQHGFARSSEWAIGERRVDPSGRSLVSLSLRATPEIRALWPHDFRLDLDVALGDALVTTLRATNPGPGPFSFTCGFHTYIRVGDVRQARVEGLQGLRFRDKVANWAEGTDEATALVATRETDRVYLGAPHRLRVRHGRRVVRIESTGFANIVVWNPGPAGDARFHFAPGEWTKFICVEPATVFEPVVVQPGGTWEGRQ